MSTSQENTRMSETANELSLRLARLEREVAELRAREAIRDLLARYSRALDWLDEVQLDSVFFDDADVDYGFFKGSGKDFKPVVMQIELSTGRRWHFGAQVTIDLDGDAADVMSYGIAIGAQTEAGVDGADLPLFMGYYLDRVERRGGKWGIARRKYVLLAGTAVKEVGLDGDMGALHKIGAASPQHPDYWPMKG
jgi:hypothetical protein